MRRYGVAMSFDVDAFRLRFPALQTGMAHFDGPGGTQTPREVGEAIARVLTGPLSNRGAATLAERNATDAVLAMREAAGDLLAVPASGVVYGRSATQLAYDFSRCMTCGCCVEACPQVSEKSNFIGPAAIGQVRLFNSHPTGKLNAEERLEAVSGADGVASCGNAQNCVQVCPKEIPLTRAIAEINRDTTLYRIKKWLGK